MRPVRQVAVSLVTVVALVGSPSIVAACAALCGSGAGHAGDHRTAAADVAQPVAEAAHHHHHGDMAPAGAPVETTPVAMTDASFSDGSCCEHGARALPSLVAAVRMELDAGSSLADHAVLVVCRLPSSRLTGPRDGPLPPWLAPAAPLVLRI